MPYRKVLRTKIEVPIRLGMEAQLEKRILALGDAQEHLFTFSSDRTIMLDDEALTLTIVWSEAGPPDDQQWRQELRAFQEAFSDGLIWEKVHIASQIVKLWD